jgi:hypothetical protein
MIERIEDIRHHRLPRYYELLNRYTQSLWHWCVFVNNSLLVTKPRQSPQNPAAEQTDRPNLPMLLCHAGEHIHSRNALAIAAAAREGKIISGYGLTRTFFAHLQSSPNARGDSRSKRFGCTTIVRGDGGGEDGLGASHGAIYWCA